MKNASKDPRITLFVLALLCVAALIYTSQQMCRLSSWIVHHDHVWAEIDRTGHASLHYTAEAFHQRRSFGGVIIQAIVGLVFLFLLWRHLFAAPVLTSPVAAPTPK